jgi:hypothetical protein
MFRATHRSSATGNQKRMLNQRLQLQFLSSWWWAMCCPKHVEQLWNIGIINLTTRSHSFGSFYEICITMHGSMNITTTSSCKRSPSFAFSYCKPARIFYPIHATRIAHLIFPDFFPQIFFLVGDRNSSVGIATCYRLGGPGIESLWGRDFSHPSRKTRGPPSLLYNGYRVSPGIKTNGTWLWSPTPSSAEVKERVELNLYSPSGSLWPLLVWNWPFLWGEQVKKLLITQFSVPPPQPRPKYVFQHAIQEHP